MKISAINPANKNSTNFKASLVVIPDVYKIAEEITSLKKFDEVISGFRHKLAIDPLNASDVVILGPLTEAPKEVCTGTGIELNGHYESNGYGGQTYVPNVTNYGYSRTVHSPSTVHYMSDENMEVAINKSRSGFLYNDDRYASQIAEDLYNTYKHVRYLEHYKAIDDAKKNN